jgi:hypothetical protein
MGSIPRAAATGQRQISRQNFECSWFAPAEATAANKRQQQVAPAGRGLVSGFTLPSDPSHPRLLESAAIPDSLSF